MGLLDDHKKLQSKSNEVNRNYFQLKFLLPFLNLNDDKMGANFDIKN